MPTTRAFVSCPIVFHDFLTHILRLKSYLYPLRHFGLPLDQNGFNVCAAPAAREDLGATRESSRFVPPITVPATALPGDFLGNSAIIPATTIPAALGNGKK
ncbi:MAG: deoxyribodipyrimidine photolyase-related protein [Circular genetic element sp.]|nr:MAG: deoxyribodipyrimidine photolyase-related protein [Circular genetic element sp.]